MHDSLTSVQRSSLHAIEQHLSSYESLKEALTVRLAPQAGLVADKQGARNALRAALQQRGLSPQISSTATCSLLSFPATPVTTPHSLLLYTAYDSIAPQPQQVQQLQTLAVALAALDACSRVCGPHTLLWLLHERHTHEGDDQAFRQLFAQHPELSSLTGCIWDGSAQTGLEDSIPHIALGCKGWLRVALRTRTAGAPIHSRHSAIVPNALWQLVGVLHSIQDTQQEVHLPGFYESVQPLAEAELESLYTLPDSAAALAQQWGMPRLLLNLHGFQHRYVHLLTPTCTLSALQAEPQDGHVPSSASATLDFHLVPGQQPQSVFAALQQHLQNSGFDDTTAHLLAARAPVHTPLTHPFAQRVQHASSIVYGESLRVLPLTAGSFPLTALEGLPCVITALGAAPFFKTSIQQLALILVGGA